MGRRGPAPKPTKLKLLHGEKNLPRINQNEPVPRDALPLCPGYVVDEVKEVWDYTVRELMAMGIASSADRDAILCYAEAVANHRRSSKLLAKSEVLIKGIHGNPVRNPALAVQRDSAELIRKFAQEFGLTPSARSRIEMGVDSSVEDDNPFARAL